MPVAAPVLLGLALAHAEVISPAEARERYGLAKPSEAHLELSARQQARVLERNVAPSDEGMVESEPILGAIA